jgi:hypothetical protein
VRKKIIGILICMLLIATTIPAVGTLTEKEISISNPREPLPPTKWGLDQEQDTNCGVGMAILPNCTLCQSFKPTINKLTAVQIHCFKYWNPPKGIKLTVSIRDSLNGSDLTELTVDADTIKPALDGGTWVMFDFPDINVTPENTYYIVCNGDGGIYPNNYAWYFQKDNAYTRGDAWYKHINESSWYTLHDYFIKYNVTKYPEPDYCFKTYTKKSKNIELIENAFFQRFLENHPNLFPLLRQLLGL